MTKPGRMVGEVLRAVTQRPATQLYPAVPVKLPAAFRGKIRFIAERCVGCKLCQKDCPADALRIEEVGKKRWRAVFRFDHCIYCAQCVDSCNKDAMESTPEFELATLDRATLKVTFDAPPLPPAPPAAPPAAPAAPPSEGGPPGPVAAG
jgi:formate hydrogenlyase subunit 6/NADH:ubiquinone oxidoreductase subunit I